MGFKDEIVVSVTVDFGEPWMLQSFLWRRFAEGFAKSLRQHGLNSQQPLVNGKLSAMVHLVRDGE